MINGIFQPTKVRTPHGGNLSPLLSNIMLNELDKELEKRGNELYFTLPFPIQYEVKELPLKQLLSLYIQTYNNKLPDEKTNDEIQELLALINKIVEEKYFITIGVENNHLIINNPNNIDVQSLLND